MECCAIPTGLVQPLLYHGPRIQSMTDQLIFTAQWDTSSENSTSESNNHAKQWGGVNSLRKGTVRSASL